MDYSKLKKNELLLIIKELENKNHDKSRDLFISNISHDVRTLLNAIYGNAQILNSDETLNSKHKKSVMRIMEASTHMIDLINNIISISKNSGDDKIILSEFKLKNLLNNIFNIFESLSKFKNINFELLYTLDKDLFIKSDKNKLFYILLNLLGNAFKYTNNGSIIISCKKILNDKILFEVKDTGIGIKESYIDNIKKNYVRINKSQEGSGLGLGIASKNLKLLGSSLKIKSVLNKGSTFSFDIKCLKNSKIFTSTKDDIFELKEIKRMKNNENFLVLIYLNDKNETSVLNTYFSERKINFKTVLNFDDLVNNVKKQSVNMIFLDTHKLNEKEVRYLEEIKKDITLVALTASVMSEDLLKINKVFTTYVSEPYSFLDLDQTLIMFSKKEFIYISKKDKKSNFKIILDENSKKNIIKEANIGNYKDCFILLSLIKDLTTKNFLLKHLDNYDFDELIKILNNKNEISYENI